MLAIQGLYNRLDMGKAYVRVFLVTACLFGMLLHADTAFPSAGGDLSSPAAWGGALPTDRVLINQPGDYSVSDDVTFNGFYINLGKNKDATFTLADGKVVTLNATFNLYAEEGYNNLYLKGGTWDLASHAFLPQNSWNSNRRHHYTLTLDGTTVTNVTETLSLGYYGDSGYNVFALTNGAALISSGKFQLSYQGKGSNTLAITTGSRLMCSSMRMSQEHANHAPSMILVDGSSSRLNMTASGSFFGQADGHSVLLRNGADMTLNGYWYLGNANKNCSIDVDAATISRCGALYLTGSNNVIRLQNGSLVNFTDRVYLNTGNYCCDSGFDITDSTNNFRSIFVGTSAEQRGTTNFFIRLSGPAAQANLSYEQSDLYRMRLIFDLPFQSYPEGHVPFTSTQTINMDGSTSLEIENLSALQTDIRAQNETKRTWRIITTTGSFNYGINSAIKAANAKYAGNAIFERSGNNVDVTVYGGAPVTLTIDSTLGSPDPANGIHTNLYGTSVTATIETNVFSGANEATRHDLLGWTLSGSVPASGTSNCVTFVQTEDSTLTWNWSNLLWQKVIFGGTLTWKTKDTELYTGGTTNWIPNGDLAQSSVWTDPTLLATERLRILAGGTYTLDRDATLSGIDFSANAEPVVFDATGRNLNLTGTINFHTKSVVTMKGGTYMMNTNSFMPQNSYANNNRKDMSLVLDGTVITNSGRFVLGYYDTTGNNTLILTNGAVYHQVAGTRDEDNSCWLCYNGMGGNLIHVSTGSRFVVPAGINFHYDRKKSASTGTTVVVDGEGSEVCAKAGGGGMDHSIADSYLIRNGGRLRLSGWWNVGTNSLISISDSAHTNTLASPYFYHPGSRFVFRNSIAQINSLFATAGAIASNNWIEVIDSEVFIDCTATVKSDETGNNVSYRFSGTHPHLRHGKEGGSAGGSRFTPNAKFVYDLPLAGYDRDENGNPIIPLDVQNWGKMDSSVIFEIENVDAVKADLKRLHKARGIWTLAYFRNHENVGAAIAASNALAPEDVCFRYANGIVKVEVSVHSGTLLLFK